MRERIGNSGRTKPALKYANPAGTCSHVGCDGRLRKAPEGWFGKFCNKCSRLLIDHGSLTTKVPSVTQQPHAVLYETIIEVGHQLIKGRNYAGMPSQGATLDRTERHNDQANMGNVEYARRNDLWLLQHYYHHQTVTKQMNKLDWLLHMTAIVGVVHMYPEGFDSDDQAALFLCKRGLGKVGLPCVRLDQKGLPASHGRFPLRTARMLAQRLKGDWGMGLSMQRMVTEAVLVKAEENKKLNEATNSEETII